MMPVTNGRSRLDVTWALAGLVTWALAGLVTWALAGLAWPPRMIVAVKPATKVVRTSNAVRMSFVMIASWH